MKLHRHTLLRRVIRKAAKCLCHYAVVAVGIDRNGNYICIHTNRHRFVRKGGGIHAEQAVMYNSPRSLSRIVIARVKGGRTVADRPVRQVPKDGATYGCKNSTDRGRQMTVIELREFLTTFNNDAEVDVFSYSEDDYPLVDDLTDKHILEVDGRVVIKHTTWSENWDVAPWRDIELEDYRRCRQEQEE